MKKLWDKWSLVGNGHLDGWCLLLKRKSKGGVTIRDQISEVKITTVPCPKQSPNPNVKAADLTRHR